MLVADVYLSYRSLHLYRQKVCLCWLEITSKWVLYWFLSYLYYYKCVYLYITVRIISIKIYQIWTLLFSKTFLFLVVWHIGMYYKYLHMYHTDKFKVIYFPKCYFIMFWHTVMDYKYLNTYIQIKFSYFQKCSLLMVRHMRIDYKYLHTWKFKLSYFPKGSFLVVWHMRIDYKY